MTQLDNQLESVALQKRQQELEAWETELTNREQLLDTKAKIAEIKVLDGRIAFAQKRLDEVTTTLSQLEADNRPDKFAKQIIKQSGVLEDLNEEVIKVSANLDSIKQTVNSQRDIKKQLEADVKDREAYQDRQEATIEQATKDANDRLHEIGFEVEQLDKEKSKLLTDIMRLEQQKPAIEDEIKASFDEIAKLTEDAAEIEWIAELRQKELDIQLEAKANQLAELGSAREAELNARQQSLEIREKSVSIKAEAQKLHEDELDSKERRLRSNFNIAGKDYDEAV